MVQFEFSLMKFEIQTLRGQQKEGPSNVFVERSFMRNEKLLKFVIMSWQTKILI